jgi:glycosyltransferase involved in cell wall biosynthesis
MGYSRPPVSVALCTYNGAPFLPAQLASISAQTVPPAEVVISDDGSFDDSLTVVEAWAAEVPFPVRIERRRAPLGVTANFASAIAMCRSDVICLSDQDDVWVPERLERLSRQLEEDGGALGVFSDASLIDAEGATTASSYLERIGEAQRVREEQLLGVIVRKNVVVGATLAFRSAARERLLPIPEGVIHDAWIANLLAADGALSYVDEPLIRYRQHGRNLIGAPGGGLVGRVRHRTRDRMTVDELGMYEQLLARATELDLPRAARDLFAAKVLHLRLRTDGRRTFRMLRGLGALRRGEYHRFSSGLQSYILDVMLRPAP